jgi:hypothetical protein
MGLVWVAFGLGMDPYSRVMPDFLVRPNGRSVPPSAGYFFKSRSAGPSKSNQKAQLLAGPSCVGYPHFDDAPWARRHLPSMAGGGSRVQDQLGLELTLLAFFIRSSIVRTPPRKVGARLPAIYRAAVAKSGDSMRPDTPRAQVLLPVPGRSRASALLQGLHQPDISVSVPAPAPAPAPAVGVALLHQWLKHHKTRLGCRPNADDAQWVERHGCRESAVRTWMSVRRGPTERRRSAGTRRSRAQPRAGPFGYFLMVRHSGS